jgi:hypothetical protein
MYCTEYFVEYGTGQYWGLVDINSSLAQPVLNKEEEKTERG